MPLEKLRLTTPTTVKKLFSTSSNSGTHYDDSEDRMLPWQRADLYSRTPKTVTMVRLGTEEELDANISTNKEKPANEGADAPATPKIRKGTSAASLLDQQRKKKRTCLQRTAFFIRRLPQGVDLVGDHVRVRAYTVAAIMVSFIVASHFTLSQDLFISPTYPLSSQVAQLNLGCHSFDSMETKYARDHVKKYTDNPFVVDIVDMFGACHPFEGDPITVPRLGMPCINKFVLPQTAEGETLGPEDWPRPSALAVNNGLEGLSNVGVELKLVDGSGNEVTSGVSGNVAYTGVWGIARFNELAVSSDVPVGEYTMVLRELEGSLEEEVGTMKVVSTSMRVAASGFLSEGFPAVVNVGSVYTVKFQLLGYDAIGNAGLENYVVAVGMEASSNGTIIFANGTDVAITDEDGTATFFLEVVGGVTGVAQLAFLSSSNSVFLRYVDVNVVNEVHNVEGKLLSNQRSLFGLGRETAEVNDWIGAKITCRGETGVPIEGVKTHVKVVPMSMWNLYRIKVDYRYRNESFMYTNAEGETRFSFMLNGVPSSSVYLLYSCQGVDSSPAELFVRNGAFPDFSQLFFSLGVGGFYEACALMIFFVVPLLFSPNWVANRAKYRCLEYCSRIVFLFVAVGVGYVAIFIVPKIVSAQARASTAGEIAGLTGDHLVEVGKFTDMAESVSSSTTWTVSRFYQAFTLALAILNIVFVLFAAIFLLVGTQCWKALLYVVCCNIFGSRSGTSRIEKATMKSRIKRTWFRAQRNFDDERFDAAFSYVQNVLLVKQHITVQEWHERKRYSDKYASVDHAPLVQTLLNSMRSFHFQLTSLVNGIITGWSVRFNTWWRVYKCFYYPQRLMLACAISLWFNVMIMVSLYVFAQYIGVWLRESALLYRRFQDQTNNNEDPYQERTWIGCLSMPYTLGIGVALVWLETNFWVKSSITYSIDEWFPRTVQVSVYLAFLSLIVMWIHIFLLFKDRAMQLRKGKYFFVEKTYRRTFAMRYVGFQATSSIVGYIANCMMFLGIVSTVLAFAVIERVRNWAREILLYFLLYFVGSSVIFMLVMRFIIEKVFYDKKRKVLRYLNWFQLVDYFSLAANFVAGWYMSIMRSLFDSVAFVLTFWRLDLTRLHHLIKHKDPGYESYVCTLLVYHQYTNPTMAVFVQLCLEAAKNRKRVRKDRRTTFLVRLRDSLTDNDNLDDPRKGSPPFSPQESIGTLAGVEKAILSPQTSALSSFSDALRLSDDVTLPHQASTLSSFSAALGSPRDENGMEITAKPDSCDPDHDLNKKQRRRSSVSGGDAKREIARLEGIEGHLDDTAKEKRERQRVRARTRWWLAITLANNPALIAHRVRSKSGSIYSIANRDPQMCGTVIDLTDRRILRLRHSMTAKPAWLALENRSFYVFALDKPDRPEMVYHLNDNTIVTPLGRRNVAPVGYPFQLDLTVFSVQFLCSDIRVRDAWVKAIRGNLGHNPSARKVAKERWQSAITQVRGLVRGTRALSFGELAVDGGGFREDTTMPQPQHSNVSLPESTEVQHVRAVYARPEMVFNGRKNTSRAFKALQSRGINLPDPAILSWIPRQNLILVVNGEDALLDMSRTRIVCAETSSMQWADINSELAYREYSQVDCEALVGHLYDVHLCLLLATHPRGCDMSPQGRGPGDLLRALREEARDRLLWLDTNSLHGLTSRGAADDQKLSMFLSQFSVMRVMHPSRATAVVVFDCGFDVMRSLVVILSSDPKVLQRSCRGSACISGCNPLLAMYEAMGAYTGKKHCRIIPPEDGILARIQGCFDRCAAGPLSASRVVGLAYGFVLSDLLPADGSSSDADMCAQLLGGSGPCVFVGCVGVDIPMSSTLSSSLTRDAGVSVAVLSTTAPNLLRNLGNPDPSAETSPSSLDTVVYEVNNPTDIPVAAMRPRSAADPDPAERTDRADVRMFLCAIREENRIDTMKATLSMAVQQGMVVSILSLDGVVGRGAQSLAHLVMCPAQAEQERGAITVDAPESDVLCTLLRGTADVKGIASTSFGGTGAGRLECVLM